MKSNKAIIIAMCFAVLIIMSVVYAAFTNSLTITSKGNAVGTMGGVSQVISCGTGVAGISGASVPVVVEDDVTINATLYQPGDTIACTITYKNNNAFQVITDDGTIGCSPVVGTLDAPVTIGLSNLVAANDTLAAGASKTVDVSISYFNATVQNDPITKNASVTCTVNWRQDS